MTTWICRLVGGFRSLSLFRRTNKLLNSGGTFDVTLLSIDNGVFEVRATSGNTHLGGEDFDQRLMEYCMSQFKRQSGIDIAGDKRAMQRLRKQCENVKRTLSTQNSAQIDCEALAQGEDFSTTISRAKFEELNLDLFKKTLTPVTQVLRDSGMSKKDVDQIILVGGSTRIPKIQSMLSEYFGGKSLNKSINPDEAVVSDHESLRDWILTYPMMKLFDAWLLTRCRWPE